MKENDYMYIEGVGLVDKWIRFARGIGIGTIRALNELAIKHCSKKEGDPLSLELIATLFNSEEVEVNIGENKTRVMKEILSEYLKGYKPKDRIILQISSLEGLTDEKIKLPITTQIPPQRGYTQKNRIVLFYKENRPGCIAVYIVRHSKQDSDGLYNQDTPLTPYKALDLVLRRCVKEYHLHTVSMHYNQDKYKEWIIGIIRFCREKELINNIKEVEGLAKVTKVNKNNQKIFRILEDASSYNQTNPYLPLGEQFREEPEGWKKMLLDLYARKSRK